MNCRECKHTWRPVKKHHRKDSRRLEAYLLDGSTVRRLGDRWNVSGSTAWRRIQNALDKNITVGILLIAKSFQETNMILLDAKHFVVRRRTYTLYVAFNPYTSKPVVWILLKGSECRDGYDALLHYLRNRRMNIEATISDNDQSIRCSITDWYPNAVQQKCAFHVLKKAFLKLNGRRLIQSQYGKKIWGIMRHIALEFDSYSKAHTYLARMKKKYTLHESAWNVLERNLESIYQFEKRTDLNIPRTSNKIENFMGVIEQRVKTFRSFKNPDSLIRIVSAFIRIKYKTSTN
jgi:transposase-like protein